MWPAPFGYASPTSVARTSLQLPQRLALFLLPWMNTGRWRQRCTQNPRLQWTPPRCVTLHLHRSMGTWRLRQWSTQPSTCCAEHRATEHVDEYIVPALCLYPLWVTLSLHRTLHLHLSVSSSRLRQQEGAAALRVVMYMWPAPVGHAGSAAVDWVHLSRQWSTSLEVPCLVVCLNNSWTSFTA